VTDAVTGTTTATTVEPLTEDLEEVTVYVSNHPEAVLYHTAAWREVITSVFGHTPRFLVARRGTVVTGVLPLYQVRFAALGSKLISIPYDMGSGGPLASDGESEKALAIAAQDLARALGVRFLQMRSGVPRPALEGLGFERSEPVLLSETDLSLGTEVYDRVSPDNRQSIRKAKRRGVEVREAESLQDFEDFYRIYLRAFRAFGTPPYGPTYFPTLWKRLAPDRLVRLLIARINGRTVGGLVMFAWQRSLISKFAAVLPEAVPARAFAALYGAAIDQGIEEGAQRLNWGTAAPHQVGLIEFKERWGAQTTPAVLYSLPVSGRVPSVSTYYEDGGLARRVWRRLPLPLTVRLGGVLNRWFC
jgi:hypothetical protein